MARDPFPGRHLGLPRLREVGVTVVPRLTGVEGTTAHFADGQSAEISTVVWSSGYRDDLEWVHMPEVKGVDGTFVQTRGISPVPGLYFVGRSWQWTRGSALLLGVGKDAAYVAAHIQQSERARTQGTWMENSLSAAVGAGTDRLSGHA
jgi:putative flavoprotein involved in K+ transport